ncbi:MAG: phosphatase PAP2 family protein [Lachnospiraceae bacterium]|nr:phosphatase PAP2 family protein [Lachnospiraceae bacterium]
MKKYIREHLHGLWVLYLAFYLPWFFWLEGRVTSFHDMATEFDRKIPFCEYFIIPYFLWFVYVVVTWLYYFFRDKKEFYRFVALLYIGMSICLTICTFFHNGIRLRVEVDPDRNFFTWAVFQLHNVDTSANVFPSIHIYNTLVCCVSLFRYAPLRGKWRFQISSIILSILICLSTVFLKQHSVLDIGGAIVLYVIMHMIFYHWGPKLLASRKSKEAAPTAEVDT